MMMKLPIHTSQRGNANYPDFIIQQSTDTKQESAQPMELEKNLKNESDHSNLNAEGFIS